MPFIKTNVSEQIEFLRETDLDFKKAWDESRTEYRLIGEMISLRTKKYNAKEFASLIEN